MTLHEALTSSEAAELLGVSSAKTLQNWLAGGHFPGAFQNADGHWRFPRHEVEAVNRRIEELRGRNARGEVVPDDLGGHDAGPTSAVGLAAGHHCPLAHGQ